MSGRPINLIPRAVHAIGVEFMPAIGLSLCACRRFANLVALNMFPNLDKTSPRPVVYHQAPLM